MKYLIRKNIQELKGYSNARDEFGGDGQIFLDANENPYPSRFNRYPDPQQRELKSKISELKSISADQIFLGNGSDEAIDLLIKCCCEPNQDSILIVEPTYGMYEVCAAINSIRVQRATLIADFELKSENVLGKVDSSTKIIFLCSPNNPTGNLLCEKEIDMILQAFSGLVVIDEAYQDFAKRQSFISKLNFYPNLTVLQTFSKAWGLAGLRLGMAFAPVEIIKVMNKIKYPYNISTETQHLALNQIAAPVQIKYWIDELVSERERLSMTLQHLNGVIRVFHSDSNFILVRFRNPMKVYSKLLQNGIVVRDRSSVVLCEGCLRITIGTPKENERLIATLKNILNEEAIVY